MLKAFTSVCIVWVGWFFFLCHPDMILCGCLGVKCQVFTLSLTPPFWFSLWMEVKLKWARWLVLVYDLLAIWGLFVLMISGVFAWKIYDFYEACWNVCWLLNGAGFVFLSAMSLWLDSWCFQCLCCCFVYCALSGCAALVCCVYWLFSSAFFAFFLCFFCHVW